MLPGEDQMRFAHRRGTRIGGHLVAVPQQLADLAVFDTVFVQVAGVGIDDVQVTIAQQADAQRLALDLERQGQLGGRIEVFNQSVTQR
ncbi:hypothetical protein D3C77_273130 [compost metagenome]